MPTPSDTSLINAVNLIDWTDWKPVWTIKPGKRKKQVAVTPYDFQENHSPTRRASSNARQRILDARLWNKLSANQQDAAIRIERACHLLNKGLGFRISSPHRERISGNRPQNIDDYQNHLTNIYLKWAQECQKEQLSHAACIDILVFGKSCSAVDTARRIRKGWARQNLDDCLNLYCKLKGWPVEK